MQTREQQAERILSQWEDDEAEYRRIKEALGEAVVARARALDDLEKATSDYAKLLPMERDAFDSLKRARATRIACLDALVREPMPATEGKAA
jgi:hypothetical protein